MSQVPHPPQHLPQPGTQVYVQQQPSNGLGVAGFVTSLIGFVTCGFLSPVGLLFSLIGLTKQPRGLAIAGTILGLLGSAWLFFVGFALVLGFLGLSRAVTTGMAREGSRANSRVASQAIEQERDRTGSLPDDAAGNALVAAHTDIWNRPLRYKRSGDSFTIMSLGADGKEGTSDDLSFTEAELRRFDPTTAPAGDTNTTDFNTNPTDIGAATDTDVEPDTATGAKARRGGDER